MIPLQNIRRCRIPGMKPISVRACKAHQKHVIRFSGKRCEAQADPVGWCQGCEYWTGPQFKPLIDFEEVRV